MADEPGLPLTTGEGNTAQELRGRIEWYVQCLRDAWAGKSVRGMDEARAGYEDALAECGRLREQLDAARILIHDAETFIDRNGHTRDPEDKACEACGLIARLRFFMSRPARAALGVEGPAE